LPLAARCRRLARLRLTEIAMVSVSQSSRIKPRALRPGDKVGIVAPASNLKREMLDAGCDGLAAPDMSRFISSRLWNAICTLPVR
jgi:hypothetical protein